MPETETFREQGRQVALVMDEYGEVQGLVTDSDFLGAIVGEIGPEGTPVPPGIRARDDRSWLVEGGLPIEDLQDALALGPLPGQEEHQFTTVAGFVLHQLGRIPQAADHFDWDGLRLKCFRRIAPPVGFLDIPRLDRCPRFWQPIERTRIPVAGMEVAYIRIET